MPNALAAGVITMVLLAGCGDATHIRTQPTRRDPVTTAPSPSAVRIVATSTRTKDGKRSLSSTRPSSIATTRTRSDVRPPRRRLVLAGRIIGIDPGHNGRNYTDSAYINRLIWNGRERETCNTTGTETDDGYTEAQFNFNVASDLAADLRAQGARVVMTRHNNTGVGPCVNVRAGIINRSHAAVAIDVHADGGPPDGRGVAVLEPVADGPNDHIIAASQRFGRDVLTQMEDVAHMPPSTYDGTNGIVLRDDLASLNLTRTPEVLIESGNMRNATDAALLTSSQLQRREAKALDRAIRQFLGQ